MTPFGYIYITTNLVNGKKYIGKRQSSFFQPNYHGSGIVLSRAIAKYGVDKFTTEVLQWCYSNEELCAAEAKYIADANACYTDDYYNIAAGGHGGNTYAGKTEAEMSFIAEKIAAKARTCNSNHGQYTGSKNSMFGRHQTKDARQRTSATLRASKRHCSHAWTAEMEAKRKARQSAFCPLWTITDQDSGIYYQYFGRRSYWLTKLFGPIVDNLDRFDWIDLHKFGQVVIKNITIVKYEVQLSTCTPTQLSKLYALHDQCIADMYSLRCGKSVTTIESILHSFEVAEEVSRVGGIAIRSAGTTV